MAVPIDNWQLLSLTGALISGLFAILFALGRMLLGQFERRLDQRFAALDAARIDGQRAWIDTFNAHVSNEQREFEAMRTLQHEFLSFRADLASNYVRRDELRDQLVRLETRFQLLDEKIDRLIFRGLPREPIVS